MRQKRETETDKATERETDEKKEKYYSVFSFSCTKQIHQIAFFFNQMNRYFAIVKN